MRAEVEMLRGALQIERVQGGNEIPTSITRLMKYMHLDDFAGVISDEIGGGNGIQPMLVAAEMGKIVLDADLMGRAYPNVRKSVSPPEFD